MPARRAQPVDDVPAPLLHYLTSGCWRGGLGLSAYLAAGAALRGKLDGLRMLWQQHGDAVKRRHRAAWAERVLTRNPGGMLDVPPSTCREEHRHRRKFSGETAGP